MQFWVYILRCSGGSYYTGHTEDLDARVWQHQQGICCEWTRRRRPVELVWCDWAPTREEAIAFERRIKGWSQGKKEALIAGDWKRIGWLAKPPHERGSDLKESVRPERSAQREVEGRVARTPEQRPSTSLRTNDNGATRTNGTNGRSASQSVRPERSAKRVVEGRSAPTPEQRPSTSLRTNDAGARQ